MIPPVIRMAHRPPLGRPPFDHKWDPNLCRFTHVASGAPLDPIEHAIEAKQKKHLCMKRHYYEKGGREKRLAKYKKRRKRARQTTLDGSVVSTLSEPSHKSAAEEVRLPKVTLRVWSLT